MKKLRTIHTEIQINEGKARVWDALFTHFGDVHLYNPSLDGSHIVKGGTGKVGCERQCDLDSRTSIVERITRAEELHSFTVEIIGGNMPMVKTMIVDIELKERSNGRTAVLIAAHFSTKPAFMGALMKGMLRAKLHDMLVGLKYHLETGATVSKKTYKPIAKEYQRLAPHESFAS